MILILIIFVILAIMILRWPYLGIIITLASLPLADVLLPISSASSVISLLGGVTLVGFLLTSLARKTKPDQWLRIPVALIPGVLFLLWMLTNFPAATLPAPDGRIWIVTFIQLWVFAWMTAVLFDTHQKVNTLMLVFIMAAFVSAVSANLQGAIGLDIKSSVRAVGLAEGANSAARYFLIALMFTFFLYAGKRNKIAKALLIICMAVLLYGVLLTVSRTGLLLLVGGVGLLFTQIFQTKKKAAVIIFILLVLFVVWFFAESIINIARNILPSIFSGADTVGIRYGLWQAGLRMWVDNPILGVGIGKFSENLSRYGWDLLQPRYLTLGAHNIYIAVLSETGIVGLFLFGIMFLLVLRSSLKATRSTNVAISDLAKNWFIVIILVLLAGITKHDHYDKLTWIVVGIGASINWMNEREQNIQPNSN